jgi:hypothetical protein
MITHQGMTKAPGDITHWDALWRLLRSGQSVPEATCFMLDQPFPSARLTETATGLAFILASDALSQMQRITFRTAHNVLGIAPSGTTDFGAIPGLMRIPQGLQTLSGLGQFSDGPAAAAARQELPVCIAHPVTGLQVATFVRPVGPLLRVDVPTSVVLDFAAHLRRQLVAALRPRDAR